MKYFILSLFVVNSLGCAAGTDSGSTTTKTTTTFTEPTGLQISPQSGQGTATQLLIGKFDSTSYPGIVLLTSTGAIFYKNQAGASWTRSLIADTTSKPMTVGVVQDLSLDGVMDLILFWQNNGVYLLTNDGSGTFSTQASAGTYNANISSLGYAAKKITDTSAPHNRQGIFLGSATTTGNFKASQQDLVFGTPFALAGLSEVPQTDVQNSYVLTADFNNDTYTDFAIVRKTSNVIQFYRNNTDATLDAPATLTRTNTTAVNDAVAVNMVGDALKDILLATSDGIELFENKGSFTFSENTTLRPVTLSVAATHVLAQDVTFDGTVDLYMAREGATSVLYSQTSTLGFKDITSSAFTTTNLGTGAIGVYAADIDADGVTDLVELFSDGTIAVHINQAN